MRGTTKRAGLAPDDRRSRLPAAIFIDVEIYQRDAPTETWVADVREIGKVRTWRGAWGGGGAGTKWRSPLLAVKYVRYVFYLPYVKGMPPQKDEGAEAREMNDENLRGASEEAGTVGDETKSW